MKASTCLIILACVVLMIVVIWAAESESATASASKTRTRSRTATRSKSPATKSRTRTRSRTRSVGSKSKTRSRSRSRTKVTPSRSKTRSRTASRTKTAAVTKTKSLTRTRSKSLSKAITKSKSLSRTRSRSLSKAITKSRSISLSRSRSLSKSKSLSQAATKSQTPSQAVTKTRTASLTKSISLSQAVTMSSSVSRSRTRTVSRSLSRSISRSSTGSPAAPSQSKTISFSPQRSLTRTRSSSKSKAVDVTPSRTASRTRTRSVSKSPSLSLAPSRTCPSGFYNPSTATGPSGDTSYFQEAYGIWKTRYVVSADPAPGLKVIDPTDCANPGRSLAQGIAYGMILSAYAVDGATFDGLLEYFEYYRTTEGCLPSVVLADGVIPPWGADCDTASAQDIAFALFVAAETWNNDAYFETATKIVTHLYDTSVDPTTQLVLPFPTPAGTSPGDILIPSYFSPAYYKLFEERDPNAAHDWEGVRQATQTLTTLIQTKQTTKLLPDFANKNGDPVSLTLGFNYRRALSGTYTSGQQTTNSVAAPAANRVALWPFRFQFDPTSNPSKLVFKITNVNVSSSVTLGGNPVTVWVKCGSSYGQATLTSIQQLTNVWVYTPSGQCTFPNGDGIDLIQPVDIRVYTDKSNTFYDFHNIESANTQCQFNRDQYDNLYSYEAVRAWFYLALDAAFYGNYPATNPSVTICSTLAATVFSTTAALDGEKYLDSNPVYNGDYGFEFIAPASLCWIVSTASGRQTVFDYLRKDGDANLLNDNQYLADTLHTLAFLFVGDEFRVPTCNAFGSTRSLPGGFDPTFEPSLGYTTDAPVIDDTAAFCLRPSTDVNVGFVSAWSVAVEFQDPNVQYYDVSIDCSGQGFVQAQAPIPDLLNTRYINTSCPESDVTIRLTPKAGYTGSEYELSGDLSSSGSLCETAPPRLQFCWKYPRSQYYLPITAGYTLTSLEAYCFSPDGLFSLDPANGGVYPYMFDKAPTSACSLTGEVALLVNGNSVVSTNLYNEDQCPFYCFVWNSGTIENGYKITVTFQDAVSAVSMDCYNGAGYQTASFEYNYAYSIPVGNCAVNGSIRLKYTHSGSANTVETNYITSACYSAEALPPGVPPPPGAPTPPPNTLGWLPFCLGPASTKNYIDVRTFVNSPAMVSGVKVYCAEGWHNATLTQDPGVPERFAGSITTCPTTAIVVELTYNTASGYMAANYPDAPTLFNADVTQTLCPKICYQAPVDTFYVGMGLSYNATNATISCNGQYVASMCLDTNLNPRYCGYFAGTDHNILSAVGDLYNAILDTVSECTTITAYFDKNAAGNSGLTTSGFEVIQGQWYTEINPFTPLPPSDPHRCKK